MKIASIGSVLIVGLLGLLGGCSKAPEPATAEKKDVAVAAVPAVAAKVSSKKLLVRLELDSNNIITNLKNSGCSTKNLPAGIGSNDCYLSHDDVIDSNGLPKDIRVRWYRKGSDHFETIPVNASTGGSMCLANSKGKIVRKAGDDDGGQSAIDDPNRTCIVINRCGTGQNMPCHYPYSIGTTDPEFWIDDGTQNPPPFQPPPGK